MKADSLRIAKVFSSGGDVHYVLPHFQREYTWDKSNWHTLLEDACAIHDEMGGSVATGSGATPPRELEHFLGSLVVIADGTRHGTVTVFKLVDGQQRLTTISLLLCALARLVEYDNPALSRRARKLLINADEDDDLHFKTIANGKIWDRTAYTALVRGKPVPTEHESRIPQAFDFFLKEVEARLTSGIVDAERLFHVLTQSFQVVFIDLNRDESPYRIFESLNGKGRPLTQADLVRNYIAMRLPAAVQQKMFDAHWLKVEAALQERRQVGRSRLGELTAFLRHYLAFRAGVLCAEEHVYARFRDRAEREFKTEADFDNEIATLARFAGLYERLLRPEREPRVKVREALSRLLTLEVSTAFPFLLSALDARELGLLTEVELLAVLAVIENYLIRRAITGEPTNFLNKLLPALWGQLDIKDATASLKDTLSVRGYPSNARIKSALLIRPFYERSELTRGRTTLILDSVNRHLSSGTGGYTVLGAAATIEHILPQSPVPDWLEEIGGDDPEQTHRELVHTLGNLTLVTNDWNSALSNSCFAIKQKKLAGHALRINADYFGQESLTTWDADAIRARGEYLADQICSIWPAFGTGTDAIKKKTSAPAVKFHQDVVDRVSQHLRLTFVKNELGQATYATSDGRVRLIVAVSKKYERAKAVLYWFAFHPSQRAFLEAVSESYMAFGCGSAEKIVLLPLAAFLPYVENMSSTTKGGRSYNHVQIQEDLVGLFCFPSLYLEWVPKLK